MRMIESKTVLGFLVLGLAAGALAEPQPTATAPAVAPAATPVADTTVTTNSTGPRLEFSTNIYEFGRAKMGDPVKYTYYFTNTGNALLELTDVHPSCGCTTAGEWTKKVEPGGTGSIPIQLNTAHFDGQVIKTVTVSSNDKQKPTQVLQLRGTIWKPIELSPAYTVLNIPSDATGGSAVVRIINNMDQPLEVFAPELSNPAFGTELKTNQPGKEFALTIKTVPPLNSGNTRGKVALKTSSTNTPLLEVPFYAIVLPAMMITPQEITLSHGPLPFKSTPIVTIKNSSTNSLTLSEPAINLPEVGVQLREMQPGQLYNVVLTFPAGFELPKGQQVALTVKCTHPRVPLIKVPVVQLPEQAAGQQPAPTQAVSAPASPLAPPLKPRGRHNSGAILGRF